LKKLKPDKHGRRTCYNLHTSVPLGEHKRVSHFLATPGEKDRRKAFIDMLIERVVKSREKEKSNTSGVS
jgi:hypothetical protein